jgi:DNA invertase Pin-like site-specific DNA recombinase
MKAIVYGAKSTTDKHGSIPTQLTEARELAEREGAEVVASYDDDGFSAYKGDRGPGLVEALAHAARVAADEGAAWLIVQHSDRLARGAGDAPGAARALTEIYHYLARLGVRVRSVQDDFTFSNPLLVAAMSMRNNEDSARKSASIKSGVRRSIERGTAQGSRRAFFGYDRGGEHGYVWNRAEREIYVEICARFTGGEGLKSIAKWLNDSGIKSKGGKTWTAATVWKVLRSRTPIAERERDGEIFAGKWEPLVDRKTWDAVQDRFASFAAQPGGGRGRRNKGVNLFGAGSVRLFCECGTPMIYKGPAGTGYAYYRCSGAERSDAHACSMPWLRADAIEPAVFSFFHKNLHDRDATRKRVADACDHQHRQHAELAAAADREVSKTAESLARVEADYLSGDLTAATYERLAATLAEERDAAAAQAAQRRRDLARARETVNADVVVWEQLVTIAATIRGELDAAVAAPAVPQAILAARAALMKVFDRINVNRDENGGVWLDPVLRVHGQAIRAAQVDETVLSSLRVSVDLNADAEMNVSNG